jgi:preprotein translocase subunit YajC
MAALIPILVLIALMYFMLIRPQQRRVRAQHALAAAIQEGDEVMTTAGIYGFVTAMDGDVAWVEIAEGVEIRVAKAALARKVDAAEHASEPPAPPEGPTDATATDDDSTPHDES